MLALIQGTAILSTVHPNGWFQLPDGSRASPAHDGWTSGDSRLAAIAAADAVPEGKRVVSTSAEIVDGEPRYVHVLEDEVPPVPDRVSSRQFKMQLAISGLRAPVEAWVAAQDELTQIAYEYSGEFVRSEPMLQAGFAALGFGEQQGDAFFTAAAAL